MPRTYYTQVLNMGDKEWGNELMEQKARHFAAKHFRERPEGDESPLVVEVYEHAGWTLTWFFRNAKSQPVIVGTANDMAVLNGNQRAIVEELRAMGSIHLPALNPTLQERTP